MFDMQTFDKDLAKKANICQMFKVSHIWNTFVVNHTGNKIKSFSSSSFLPMDVHISGCSIRPFSSACSISEQNIGDSTCKVSKKFSS